MSIAQPLNPTGHSKKFTGEGEDESRPQALPSEDAHANKTYFGKSGKLKSSRPLRLGGDANAIRNQSAKSVQKARKRTK
jgi:hypothetical protein